MATVSYHFYSRYLAHQTQVCAVLPEINEDPLPDSYPVLYLLHGRGDDCTSYIRNSSIERYANEHQVIVIMPSAETSFYVDGVYGKRFFSYMTKELPRAMGHWLPIAQQPDRTFIAGLSMGAYGALKIGLTFPETFAGIGIMSAGIRPDQLPDFMPTREENDILHEDVRRAFGDGTFKPEDDPQELIKTRLSEKRAIPPILHYEGRQDMLYGQNSDFRAFAESLGLNYRYEEWDGEHDWLFWEEALRRLMNAFFKER